MNEIPIIFENTDFVAVNKPSGLKVHPDGVSEEETLVDWVIKMYPSIRDVGESQYGPKGNVIERPGIVHRLDRDTSGVLLIAKNKKTFAYLKELFQSRTIEKVYHAFVYGEIKEYEGKIDTPIMRSKTNFRVRKVLTHGEGGGREALTLYRALKRFPEYSFLEVRPRTGRTHQVRVHLKSIGHPVCCDNLYAPKKECPESLGRLGLHAYEVKFPLPDKSMVALSAEDPPEFLQFLQSLEARGTVSPL